MTWRRLKRSVAMGWALLICLTDFAAMRLRGEMTLARRAVWLQRASRRVLRSMGIRYEIEGEPPARGLAVSNHLSYLDIVLISAAMPCCFVSKSEVGRWPYFGLAARLGGTLFLDRTSRASANRVAREMEERLVLPTPVLLFPEGTSTDGSEVLRFRARLLEPAVRVGAPITPASVTYTVDDGSVAERELCWFGDAGFVGHLWKALGVGSFRARLRFGAGRIYADARTAALETHRQVEGMRLN